MSAPAAPNTLQGNTVVLTINLKAKGPPAIPLVYGEDAAASAAATGLARLVYGQLDVGDEPNYNSDVVKNLVQSAQAGYVSLSRNDVIHVYLLGWAWVAGAFKEVPRARLQKREPMQERLRQLLTSGDGEDDWFIDELCANEGSIAWMRRILNAAATALK